MVLFKHLVFSHNVFLLGSACKRLDIFRIQSPQFLKMFKNFFKVGQKVEVMASAKDEEAGKLSLSAKQLAKDPFEEISAKYAKDQKVTGSVSKVVRGGIYITLEHGLEGFVLASKIPPNESWEAGKTVQCMVESVDVASRKITLVPYALEKPIFYR